MAHLFLFRKNEKVFVSGEVPKEKSEKQTLTNLKQVILTKGKTKTGTLPSVQTEGMFLKK